MLRTPAPPVLVTACPLCNMDFDTNLYVPYVASCGHNVCVQCLHEMRSNICPVCGQDTFGKTDINYLAMELIYQIDQAHRSLEEAKGIFDTQVPEQHVFWREQGTSRQTPTPTLPVVDNQPETPQEEQQKSNTIEIYNISAGWQKIDLNQRFGDFGRIVKSYLPRYQDGRNKGMATITYELAESAEQAVFAMNDSALNDENGKLVVRLKTNKMPLNKAVKKTQKAMNWNPKTTVRISNLGSVTEEQLRKHFSQYGIVVAVRINRDPFGNPTGIGLVNYKFDHSAQMAIKNQHKAYFPSTNMIMYVEEYTPNM